jgi:hypothetical protein
MGDTGGSGGTAAGGTGGTAGAGGSGGSGGSGGTGGSALPPCATGSTGTASVQLVDAAGVIVAAAVTAPVTVASADICNATTCPTGVPGAALKIALTGAAQSWTLYLYNTAMPADLIKAGDTYDMTVRTRTDYPFYTSIDQTIVLAHGTDLVAFAAQLTFANLVRPATGGESLPEVPDLSAFGVTVADLGTGCARGGCSPRSYTARVTVGADSVSVPEYTTVNVGWLSFTSGDFKESVDTGVCDNNDSSRKAHTQMAGFRLP